MSVESSDVLSKLPPYLFASIDEAIRRKRKEGVDVISFGVGDPDLPAPKNIVDALKKSSEIPENHQYPSYQGKLSFREAVCSFYKRKWSIGLDPGKEVMTSVGAKEAVHNAAFAFQKGSAIVPNPAYPVYSSGALFAGRSFTEYPVIKEKGFLPDLDALQEHAKDSVYMWANYPNNPTAATIDKPDLRRIVSFCRDNGLVLFYDNTYSEMTYDDYVAPSPLEFGKEGVIEFHSLSKTYSMTGFRLGWIAGDEKYLQMILSVKKNIDSGTANMIQDAGTEALNGPQDTVRKYAEIYSGRRNVLLGVLKSAGISAEKPRATFYVWADVPEEFMKRESPSMAFSGHLLDKAGIVATPGVGFGRHGEGYVRFVLTQPEERIREAGERLKKL